MPRTPEVRLTSQDNTTLGVRPSTGSPTTDPTVQLSISMPDGAAASIQLTGHSVRVLLAVLEGYLDDAAPASPEGLPRVTFGPSAEQPESPPMAGQIPVSPASLAVVPDPQERLAAQIAVDGAVETRRQAATWLATVHCQHAAYAVTVAYPEAASIVVDISSPSEDGLTVARLLEILDSVGIPVDLPISETLAGATYWAVTTVVEQSLEAALALRSDRLPWAGQHTLTLSDFATW
ncbi:hypothetical protein [Parafrankia sp. EUN1f]|uniref:hypothetical protein n=1 Tax=Parafrankia sp. EUN1f TaxID=102897 RepID=UPI0001C45209|nr:hypothetical protein [Parafrankia sp. EUN1f]EFC82852.1 hypothetical protein FrEUN1fDRAFT_4049 [Parafrankia sp. EUN1f]